LLLVIFMDEAPARHPIDQVKSQAFVLVRSLAITGHDQRQI